MVDEARLLALLDRIGAELAHLHRAAARDAPSLLDDEVLLAAVKYRFIVAIEAAVDACRHVIASEGLPAPADYAGAFAVLGEAGFLPAEQVPALQAMARFRNLLVHGYARVDDRIVVELLQHRLGDLAGFRRAVAARLS